MSTPRPCSAGWAPSSMGGVVRGLGLAAVVRWQAVDGAWMPHATTTHPEGNRAYLLENPPEDAGRERGEKASRWVLPLHSPACRACLVARKAKKDAWKARQDEKVAA